MCIPKTFWLKIIQRKYKKYYKELQKRIQRAKNPKVHTCDAKLQDVTLLTTFRRRLDDVVMLSYVFLCFLCCTVLNFYDETCLNERRLIAARRVYLKPPFCFFFFLRVFLAFFSFYADHLPMD